jgi:hypothetical protein
VQQAIEQLKYNLSPKWTLIYILILSVFVDIAYGVLSFIELGSLQIALLFRMSIIMAFLVALFRYNDIESWFFKALMIIWLVCLGVWVVSFGWVPIQLEVNYFLRAIFPLGIALLAYGALRQGHIAGKPVDRWIFIGIISYASISAISIVLSFLTGFGNLTYGPWAFGYKSFFTGGNDIGLAMLIGLVMAWCRLWRKDSLPNVLLILLI